MTSPLANTMCPCYEPKREAAAYAIALINMFGEVAVGHSFTAAGGPGSATLQWEEDDIAAVV